MTNLMNWNLVYEKSICPNGIRCLEWNKNAFDIPCLAIGCVDNENGFFKSILNQNLASTNLFRIFIE